MKFLDVRVRNLVARFRGRVTIWDATNELLWEPPLAEQGTHHWPHLATIANIAATAWDEDCGARLCSRCGIRDDCVIIPP
jgi:hypothetical protein